MAGETAQYYISVDWDGDGTFDAGINEATRLIRFTIDRGRDNVISQSGGGFEPCQVGRAIFTLDNYDRRYDPWNTDGALYGNILPGRKIKIFAHITEEGTTDVSSIVIMNGKISDIQMNGYANTVNVIMEDYWADFADNVFFYRPMQDDDFNPNPIMPSHFPHQYLQYIYESIAVSGKFESTAVYSTDLPYEQIGQFFFCQGRSHKKEIENVVNAYIGTVSFGKAGTFKYRSFGSTDFYNEHTITEDMLLKNIYMPMPWANVRDKVILKGKQCVIATEPSTSIIDIDKKIKLKAGETFENIFHYDVEGDPVIYTNGYPYNYLDLTAFNSKTSTASTGNVTSDITTSDTFYYPDKANVILKNNGANTAWVHTLNLTGGYMLQNDIEYEFATDTDSSNVFILESPYIAVCTIYSTDTIYENVTSDTPGLAYSFRTQQQKDWIDDIGHTLLNYLSTPRMYPTIQMTGRLYQQFRYDVEDKVTLSLPSFGTTDEYYIHKISHVSQGTPQDVLTTLKLYPIMTLST